MSISLGWLAVLASLAGSPVPKSEGPDIIYQFKIIELRGLEWRKGAPHGLKPVASRGGVTIWTAPKNLLDSLPDGTGKQILAAPRIVAASQAAAHITTRKSHPFVTQVAWRGDDASPRETVENVREGMAATVSGRCIDQGVLVQLVIEDTEVRKVHTLDLDAGKTDRDAKKTAWHPSAQGACCADDEANAEECHAARAGSCRAEKSACAPKRSALVQVPEIGRGEIAGEWLIPRDEVLLVGFGPHTVADNDGKAVVRERLAMITTEEVAAPVAADAEPLGFPRPLPRVAIPSPAAPLPSPGLPSRSLPQGIHVDGTPADLPPLPDDEKEGSSSSESADPRPSPQKKVQPGAGPAAKPAAADNKTTKAAFPFPKGLFQQAGLPQIGFPSLQFMMPLKPFGLKLPFNQKLELELIGRVVADPDAATDSSGN
jgi:hypothetical protein